MKKSATVLVLCFLISSLVGSSVVSAGAISPTPPAPTAPDVFITSIAGTTVGGKLSLDDVEIYNQTDTPIDLSDWQLTFSVSGCSIAGPVSLPKASGWILPKHYLNFERATAPTSPTDYSTLFGFTDTSIFTGCKLASMQLSAGGQAEQTILIPNLSSLSVQHKQRSNATSTLRTITGDFTTDYPKSVADLRSDLLYSPPDSDNGLRLIEMLPHARDCSPTDTTSPDCSDYIKLYNPTNKPIDLSHYRLRVGHKGQSTSVTNTFHFGQMLGAGKYFALVSRDDGEPLSLTDSGNFVWLEDSEGVKTFGPIMAYPDASSTTKIGQAWAFDGTNWRWTSAPHPLDANYFPPSTPVIAPAVTPTLKPCGINQYRSSETNRCRKIVVSASTLVPCKPDQTRNEETNRCRSILTSSSTLQSCKANQVRNPATNRCKSTTSANGSLKPCQPGWSRNPDTNRCRKGSVLGSATTQVQDVKSPMTKSSHWLLISVIVLGALAYGLYEWRQELGLKLAGSKRLLASIGKTKK